MEFPTVKVVHYFWPPVQENHSYKKPSGLRGSGFLNCALLHINVVLGFNRQHAKRNLTREMVQNIGISGDHLAQPSQPPSFFTFFVLALAAHVP